MAFPRGPLAPPHREAQRGAGGEGVGVRGLQGLRAVDGGGRSGDGWGGRGAPRGRSQA